MARLAGYAEETLQNRISAHAAWPELLDGLHVAIIGLERLPSSPGQLGTFMAPYNQKIHVCTLCIHDVMMHIEKSTSKLCVCMCHVSCLYACMHSGRLHALMHCAVLRSHTTEACSSAAGRGGTVVAWTV